LKGLHGACEILSGIDKSIASLQMATEYLKKYPNIKLAQMDAVDLGFKSMSFDIVFCLQNGISAFKVDNLVLISTAYRVLKPHGVALFSTYKRDFWAHRLKWFESQAAEGLLGEVDYQKTGDGEIVCKDGFRATTYAPSQLQEFADKLGLKADIYEVDSSSVFLEICKH
jgi:2-polyprenyl-6-hydroxyphenyl methylase/3-demethylubiquinone-9 3-methyltransferase